MATLVSEPARLPRGLRFHPFLREFLPAYLEGTGTGLLPRQRKVLHRILCCRTPALGGQLYACPSCPRVHYRYHSCNDRHCPQCGDHDTQTWLARQQRLLVRANHFLFTFTVPEALRAWIYTHPKLGYDLLFAASSQALQDVAALPKHLGGPLGMMGVLHTWSRTLIFHPHIHYFIPGGALSSDGCSWIPARHKFLLPVKVLSLRVRTLFRQHLEEQAPELLKLVPRKVWRQPWIVHGKATGAGDKTLAYLANYIFKTASANRPLNLLPTGQVQWPYKDNATGQWLTLKLQPQELIRRFVQHVLPEGYCRVRCFGWLHPAAKARLNRIRALLRQTPLLSPREQAAWQLPENLLPEDPPVPALSPPVPVCPHCQKPMLLVASWFAGSPVPRPEQARAP